MTDSHAFSLIVGTSFVVAVGLDIAYWVNLDKIGPGDSCYGAPYNWGVFSKWYLMISAILLFMILALNHSWKHDYSKLKKTIIFLMFLPNLGTIAYIIGSFIAFHYRDQCRPLHDLTVVSFWISIMILLAPFVMCFLLCLSGGVAAVRGCFHACFGDHTTGAYTTAPDVHVHTTQPY